MNSKMDVKQAEVMASEGLSEDVVQDLGKQATTTGENKRVLHDRRCCIWSYK